jgi:hypothetical protein
MKKILLCCTTFTLALSLFSGCALTRPKLVGTVNGTSYTGARGDYTVPFPVDPVNGGRATGDDRNGVTFRDDNQSRISFYSYSMKDNNPILITMNTEGCQKALQQYVKLFYRVDAPNYHPEIRDGTASFYFLKDGVTPCGAAAFIHSNYQYTVEVDVIPAVQFFAKYDEKTSTNIPPALEKLALKLIQTIQLNQ